MSVVLVGMLLLTGCAQHVWVKDGATQQQFSADQFDCKQKAYTMVGGYNSNNLGALVVDAPGFFNECMQSKGYQLTTQTSANTPATAEENIAWLEKNASDGDKIWVIFDPEDDSKEVSRKQMLDDYWGCEAKTGTHKARTCMEALGYRSVYPAMFIPANMTKVGKTHAEKKLDKLACNAPTPEQIRACLQEKGYVPRETVASRTQ
jgi:hypothetical protein